MTTKTCRINEGLLDELQAYSDITGVPVGKCIDEAVARWLQSVAPARIKAMQRPVFGGGPTLVSGDAASEDLIALVKERKGKK